MVTLPALGLLRARWPEAWIELVGHAAAAQLAVGRYYLDAAHAQSDARWSRLGTGALRADEPLGEWLREFDLVINYGPDGDGAIAADFARLGFVVPTGPALHWGFITHPAHPTIAPAAAHYCAALAPLGLAPRNFAAPLMLNDPDRAGADALLPPGGTRLIAWHPGSGSPKKNWPAARWRAVLAALSPHQLVITPGPAEEDFTSALPGAIVRRGLCPVELAAVYSRCALFLGVDTGPAHVAAAVGCPCVLVFGPTDPAVWAPHYAHVRAIRRGPMTEDVTVEDVVAAARNFL